MYKFFSLPSVAWPKSAWRRLAIDLVIGPRRSPLPTRRSPSRRSPTCARRSSLPPRRSWFCYCISWGVEFGPLPSKTQPRSIPFATKLFTPHFAYICDNSPPRLLKNHDFTYSTILLARHKKSIHPTWPTQNPTKINSFCNQTFHTSFCIHLWHFPHPDCTKTMTSLFHQLRYLGTKSQSTQLGSAKTQPR